MPADALLRRVETLIGSFGITRVGRLTGLDRVGVPVWMATRPNAANLSVSQGKGLDDDVAKLAAILESIELAVAEGPISGAFSATRRDLEGEGHRVAELGRYVSTAAGRALDPDRSLRWVEGVDLLAGAPIVLPEGMTTLLDVPGCLFQQTSDGFGAGACLLEAVNHGLCELVERDAVGLWSFRSPREVLARETTLPSFGDDALRELGERIAQAGLRPRLFDLTNDLGIPAFLATISGRAAPVRGWRHLDLASGTGAHPCRMRAVRQAVLEAVQTRMTTIAGARDDIDPEGYDRALAADLAVYVAGRDDPPVRRPSSGRFEGDGPELLDHLLDRLRAVGLRSAVAVPLTDEGLGLSVARVFVPGLEQHPQSRHRRLGPRGLAALMGRR